MTNAEKFEEVFGYKPICRKYNIPYVTLMHWQSGYSKPPKYVETILKMLVTGEDKHE